MPNIYQFPPAKPILKRPPQHKSILSISPAPPTIHREIPSPPRENISRKSPELRENLSLIQSIDYDKLTPSQQAKWDAGIYGSIHLRSDVRNPYYCLRWKDPLTKKLRSTKLGHTYPEAISALKKLTAAELI